jgi:hypothetical protein
MGAAGTMVKTLFSSTKNKGEAFSGEMLMKRATGEGDAKPPEDTQTSSLGDEQIRNAILAERSRLIAGQSRKAAFAVGSQSTSSKGTW